MPQPLLLLIEDKPLYAEAMASQLDKWGFVCIIVSNHQQAVRFLAEHQPSLMLVNVGLVACQHLLWTASPFIRYELHDGSRLNHQPEQAWIKGRLLSFPCSPEHFEQAVELTIGLPLGESLRLESLGKVRYGQKGQWVLHNAVQHHQ